MPTGPWSRFLGGAAQVPGAVPMPARSASFTRSATTRTPILRIRLRAVELDRLLDRAQVGGNLLVQRPATICSSTCRSRSVSAARQLADTFALHAGAPPLPVGGQGLLDGRQQLGVVDRLGEEVGRAVFHRLHRGGDVAAAGEKDDGQRSWPVAPARAAAAGRSGPASPGPAPGSPAHCGRGRRETAWADAKVATFSRPIAAAAPGPSAGRDRRRPGRRWVRVLPWAFSPASQAVRNAGWRLRAHCWLPTAGRHAPRRSIGRWPGPAPGPAPWW